MLAYLIATSILNVLLGYALAVYLMRATEAAEFTKGHSERATGLGQSSSRNQSGSATAARSDSSMPIETIREAPVATRRAPPLPKGSSAPEVAPLAPARDEAADEQQLIAGIADFRSQLARLRSDTSMEEATQGAFGP